MGFGRRNPLLQQSYRHHAMIRGVSRLFSVIVTNKVSRYRLWGGLCPKAGMREPPSLKYLSRRVCPRGVTSSGD